MIFNNSNKTKHSFEENNLENIKVFFLIKQVFFLSEELSCFNISFSFQIHVHNFFDLVSP